MALTSLLWISISLWPARKREKEIAGRGWARVRQDEGERRDRRRHGLLLLLVDAEGRETREKGREERRERADVGGRRGNRGYPWICQFFTLPPPS